MTRILYTMEEAAAAVGVTPADIQLAINQSDAPSVDGRYRYPPLHAKKIKRGRHMILHEDLVEWARSLPDA